MYIPVANQCIHVKQEADPDNYDLWEKLIRSCESLEGGLNRNSSPHALATLRDAYDRFLLKFPLFFGYWKKYANLEFNISGPESAEIVCAKYLKYLVYGFPPAALFTWLTALAFF